MTDTVPQSLPSPLLAAAQTPGWLDAGQGSSGLLVVSSSKSCSEQESSVVIEDLPQSISCELSKSVLLVLTVN